MKGVPGKEDVDSAGESGIVSLYTVCWGYTGITKYSISSHLGKKETDESFTDRIGLINLGKNPLGEPCEEKLHARFFGERLETRRIPVASLLPDR